MTPDRDFVVDRLPGHPSVTVGLGAAHGFKFAALFGRLLTDMAVEGESRYDLCGFPARPPGAHRSLLRRELDGVNLVDYAEINRLNWDERAPAHAASPDYHVAKFAQDPDFLSYVVRFDRPRLGDIAGLRGVHLQCHIGTDTISLARLGAHMTGLDFSPR